MCLCLVYTVFFAIYAPKPKKDFSSSIAYTARQNVSSVMYELRSKKQWSIEYRVYEYNTQNVCSVRNEPSLKKQPRKDNTTQRTGII
jgi:hypothetical protein